VAGDHKQDLYATLGVARDSDDETIRKAYRKLARRYHPDVNPGDSEAEERFKEISEAYALLSSPEKRRAYDEFGEISLEGGFDPEAARRAREAFGARFGGGGDFAGFGAPRGESFGFGNADDLFSDLFSRRGWSGGPRARRGADLQAELMLDFLDAARGGEHRLTLARPTAEGGLRHETVTVRIPPGVADGGSIRLRGKGAEGRGDAPAGDLIAHIRVKPHPHFRRESRNLHVDLPLSVREATLGAEVEVPTLEGRVTVSVPPGTDSGTKLRLRGKGVADPSGGPPGDLYVNVQIRVPRNLDEAAAAKVEALSPFDPPDLRKDLG
jgi:DnaJ-class molecular chaperone